MKQIIVAALLLLTACQSGPQNTAPATNQSQRTIAEVQLKDLNDQPVNLEKYRGKTVFLNFWATWCKPCIAEMPSIQNAQQQLQNEQVVFILASGEDPTEIALFKQARGYNFNYMRVENSEALGIVALPTTFIYDANGKLVFSETGVRKWDDKNNIALVRNIANEND
jgi:thiol-disulfide isomerase/thioredoxin